MPPELAKQMEGDGLPLPRYFPRMGRVVGEASPGVYLVSVAGTEGLVKLDEMKHWDFFDTAADMRYGLYEQGYVTTQGYCEVERSIERAAAEAEDERKDKFRTSIWLRKKKTRPPEPA